jgi:hypothetical protein
MGHPKEKSEQSNEPGESLIVLHNKARWIAANIAKLRELLSRTPTR